MAVTLQIPLDIPDIRLLSSSRTEQGDLLLTVESTHKSTPCHRCGRELTRVHGLDRAIRLQHLPILEQPVWIEIRPRRFQCRHCQGHPTTTQRLDWYEPNSPNTKAFDRWLMKLLINSTLCDVARRAGVSPEMVEGALSRCVPRSVDWSRFEALQTLGIDEIALKKGHKDYVAVISVRDAHRRVSVLAVLPERLKATVIAFLGSIPPRLRASIERVCTDIHDGYIEAVREVLPHVEIVLDRFHVAQNYHRGVDRFRRQELARLKQTLPAHRRDELKGLMWPFRRHYWDLTDDEHRRLLVLFLHAPALLEAYWLRHHLTVIFNTARSKAQALEMLKAWQQRLAPSALDCFDTFLTTLNNWRDEITNYFNGRHSSGFVEGLNNRLKVIKRRCYGLLKPVHLFQRIQLDLEGERLWA